MKLSIIMPVYNERDTLREILRQVRAVELPGIDKEILVVDDGSTDGSREILAEEARSCPVATCASFTTTHNRGKGAAVRTGIEQATGDILLIQDADLEYDPRDYPALIRPIVEGRVTVVYGSRFLGPRKAMLFWHMLGNKLLTLTTNILYNTILSDMETCYKCFRADVVKGIPLHARALRVRARDHGQGAQARPPHLRGADLLLWPRVPRGQEDQLARRAGGLLDAGQVPVCGLTGSAMDDAKRSLIRAGGSPAPGPGPAPGAVGR